MDTVCGILKAMDIFAPTNFEFMVTPSMKDVEDEDDNDIPSQLGNEWGGIFVIFLTTIMMIWMSSALGNVANRSYSFETKPTMVKLNTFLTEKIKP